MQEGLVKIRFTLDPANSNGLEAEGVWAKPVGDGRYLLQNVPFYAYGVSYGDVVWGDEGQTTVSFAGIFSRGGHSTYRLFLCDGLDINSEAFRIAWSPIKQLGCTYENANSRWVALDIPPETDADAVYELLERGENDGVWTFEEGHSGHTVGNDQL